MAEKFTVAQVQRLIELNEDEDCTSRQFNTVEERNQFFKTEEQRLVRENREKLKDLMDNRHMPLSLEIERDLTDWLTGEEGFTKVATPIIIGGDMLEKMGISMDHPLRQQIFWVDGKKCLRPMLAPNLYQVMGSIQKITGQPVRIFEIGSCFRKESQGANHMNEFTMLNMVELAGVSEGNQMERLEGFAARAMKALNISDYKLVKERSEVYGDTLDIEIDGMEVASAAYGPHPLDSKWAIFDTWVGIGFGIERLAMAKGHYRTIKRGGKTNNYIDGIPLKL